MEILSKLCVSSHNRSSILTTSHSLCGTLQLCKDTFQRRTRCFGRPALKIVCAKKADISRRPHWFLCEMTSEKRMQKFHTDDVHYPDLDCALDWLKQISLAARPVRSTFQILVVTRHQYRFSVVVAQTSFAGKPVMSVVLWGYGRKGSLCLLNETLILPYVEKHCFKSLKDFYLSIRLAFYCCFPNN